jgi:hypothetical protein
MKLVLPKKKTKPAKQQSTFGAYTTSYIDKRSKTYHKITMTAFAGMFGLFGAAYLFGAQASRESASSQATASQSWLEAYGPLLFAALVAAAVVVAYISFRMQAPKQKKRK